MHDFQVPQAVREQVEKAVHALEFVARRLNRRLFSSAAERANVLHDLQVIRTFNNLKSVTVEYLGANRHVVFDHTIEFSPNANGNGRCVDAGRGIELPLLPPSLIVEHLFSISWCDRSQRDLLKHLLNVPWSNKEEHPKARGTTIRSVHHEKITGGNNTARLHVTDLARHFGRISYVAEGRGFAFANDEVLGQTVWCHVSHAPTGFRFRVGDRVSFVVVDVPKGLQARDIRSA
jgi:cold shock CspA family protein